MRRTHADSIRLQTMLVAAMILTLPMAACDIFDDDDGRDRFVDLGDGTVWDTRQNLIWLKNAACLGSTDWDSAVDPATGLPALLADSMCDLTDGSAAGDWRLPTKEQWETMIADAVMLGCTIAGDNSPPSITNTSGSACHDDGPQAFDNLQSTKYWSSTEFDVNGAWAASLNTGLLSASLKSADGHVWPVRDP